MARRRGRTARLAVLAAALVLLLGACIGRQVDSDPIPFILLGGARYFGAVPVGMTIPEAALAPVGDATEVHIAPTIGTTVYSLAGVSPEVVLAMKKPKDENGVLWIFFREGGLPTPSLGYSDKPGTSAFRIPGMCKYATNPQAVGCA